MSKRKRATLTDLLNDLTFKTIYDKYYMVCLNMFEWSGLPDGIEEKHIEHLLFKYGKAIFFKDPNMAHMVLQAEPGAHLNVYGEPLTWRAVGLGYNEEYKADECVIISNNKPRIPTHDFIMFYANKLTEAERTMDVNIKANKTPYVFACDQNNVLTFKQIFEKVDGNVPAIFADKGLTMDAVSVFQTGVKFLCNEITDYKHSIESDLLTFLGENNVGIDKAERLVVDEAKSNNQQIASFRDIMLTARQDAAKAMSEMSGRTVTVKCRNAPMENPVETVEKEGDGHVGRNAV